MGDLHRRIEQLDAREADGRAGDVPALRARVAAVEIEFADVRVALLAARAAG